MVRSKASLDAELLKMTPKSRALWERGKDSMPGGIIKGAYWRPPHPIYVQKAEGCHIWDIDGNRYVDFENHHSTTVLGHNPPGVMAELKNAMEMGIGLGHPTEYEAEISEEITRRFPSIERVRFANSGTEASLHATRLIRAKTGKPKIAKFEGAYHGSHDALEVSVAPPLDKAGEATSPKAVPTHKGMSRAANDEVIILPYNDRESVELILREHKDEVAGVFYDGKPGMLDIPDDFTKFVRKITQELGMYMVMDEVVSFRAGPGGYQGEAGVKPDLSIFGKAFGGGLPVGAIGGRRELMDVLDNTGAPTGLFQSGTFSGNHFTLAAGLATLRGLTPEVYEQLEGLRARLHKGLEAAFKKAGVPCQVLSRGSMINAYIAEKPVKDYRSARQADGAMLERIIVGLLIKGYSIGPTPMSMTLSTPMSDATIDGFLKALSEVLADKD
ncbi:MAG: aspartate aminotransferase family protein [SAR202 cluster bacterium]|nr:aspartate aminotransferase family protein [SAR202 cluster bacterium]